MDLKNKFSIAFIIIILSGCTNAIGGKSWRLFPIEESGYSDEVVFGLVKDYFQALDYQCASAYNSEDVECEKYIRDLGIHTTRVEVRFGVEKENGQGVSIRAIRWDEGLIPSELLSESFESHDIHKLCSDFKTENIAHCVHEKM